MSGKPAGFSPAISALGGILAVLIAIAGLSACGDDKGKPVSEAVPGNGAVFKSPTSTVLTRQNSVRLVRMKFEDTLEVPVRIDLDERRSVLVTSPAAGRLEEVFIRSADQAMKAGNPIATLFAPELVSAQREYLLLAQKADSTLLDDAAGRLLRMGMTSGQIRSIRRTGKPMERIPIPSPKAGFVVPAPAGTPVGDAMGGMGGAGPGGGAMGGMADGEGDGMGKAAGGSAPSQGGGAGQGMLKAGSYVERGTPLASLNDLAVVAATLALPMDLASLFSQGDSIHLSIPSVYFSAMARLDYLESRVTDTNRVLVAKAYVPNPGLKLKVGTLGKAHLAPRLDSVWAVPRTAVRNQGEKWMVWSRSAADTTAFEAREVRLGRRGRRFVEITRGLSPGDAVAENPSLLVDPDAIVEPLALPESGSDSAPSAHPDSHLGRSDTVAHDSHVVEAPAKEHGGHGDQGPPAPHSGKEPHSEKNSSLMINSEKEVLAGIRTDKARTTLLTPSIIFRATIRFDDRAGESVPTRVEGTVEFVRVRRPGERVVKGQVLGEIRSDTFRAAQQEFLLAVSQSKALPDKAMARTQVQAARRRLSVLGMSDSGIEALIRDGKSASRHPIVSPKSGIILAVDVQPGQYVKEGASLFVVGGSDRIWAETWMLPEELIAYPEGSEAWVEVEGLQGEPIRGRLEHVRQGAAVSGALAIAHVGIPNPDGKILPGLQAWVTLKEKGRQALTIPPSALQESSKSIMAWLRVSRNEFAPRMVKVGLRTPAAVEIIEGIREGEEVVVSGAYLLNSEWIIRQGAGKGHGGH